MSTKGIMAPVFEKGIPAALCTKACGRWKKIKGNETVIVCIDEAGEKSEVVPRAVCMPWLEVLMRSNNSMARDVRQRKEDDSEQVKNLRISLEELRSEKSHVVHEAVRAKGDVVRLKKELVRRDDLLEDARKAREKVDVKAERAMKKNQEVRDFAKDKVRHESELVRVQKDAARTQELEKLNVGLVETRKKYEAQLGQQRRQVEALTKRVLELQAVEVMLQEEKAAKKKAIEDMTSVVDKKEAKKSVPESGVAGEDKLPEEKVS